MIRSPHLAAALCLTGILCLTENATPQNDPPPESAASDTPSAPTAPTAERTPPTPTLAVTNRKRSLFREGASLLEAAGTMRKELSHNNWVFTTTSAESPLALDPDGHTFILLPCVLLGEMQQIHDANPQASPVVFELTGTIFTYRNRNYLLPTFAPRLIGHAESHNTDADTNPNINPNTNDGNNPPARIATQDQDDQDNSADADDSDDPADPDADADNTGHSVEDIMNRLREGTGPVTTATSDDRDLNLPRTVTGRTPLLHTDEMIREGTDLVNRRGRIIRDAAGSWTFVFDADAQGLSDPPMTVLPCTMLESMERIAARAGNSAVMLLTGSVYSYGQRNYVMPSVFRIPNDRSGINEG